MGRKSHTQKFLVANLTSRENQTRQATFAVSSHAPFRKWRLFGASPFADFSDRIGRYRRSAFHGPAAAIRTLALDGDCLSSIALLLTA
jgi:hypothetical protein